MKNINKHLKKILKTVEQLAIKFDFSSEIEYDDSIITNLKFQKTLQTGKNWIIEFDNIGSIEQLNHLIYDLYYETEVQYQAWNNLNFTTNDKKNQKIKTKAASEKEKLDTLNDMSVWLNSKKRSKN